jgi:hypothetical protein
MIVKKPVLVSGESISNEWAANFVIDISAYGLSKFCADDHMWAVGMKGKEALGGRLFVTNYRLIFATHPVNRVVGEFGIPLEIVEGVKNKSFLVVKKIAVLCALGEFQFVVWNVNRLMTVIEERKRTLDVGGWHAALRNEKDALTSGNMHISLVIETANRALNVVGAAKKIADAVANPLEFIRDALIEEALEKLVKEPINRYIGER